MCYTCIGLLLYLHCLWQNFYSSDINMRWLKLGYAALKPDWISRVSNWTFTLHLNYTMGSLSALEDVEETLTSSLFSSISPSSSKRGSSSSVAALLNVGLSACWRGKDSVCLWSKISRHNIQQIKNWLRDKLHNICTAQTYPGSRLLDVHFSKKLVAHDTAGSSKLLILTKVITTL